MSARAAVGGIFVGGVSSRMGGLPKGLLLGPDGRPIIERLADVLRQAGISELLLVGRREGYDGLGLEVLADDPPGVGPLGGLVALLARAGECLSVSVACDMPFVTTDLVVRLLTAPPAPVVAPRVDGRWQPLCARYDSARLLPAARNLAAGRDHSLQRLLDEVGANALSLSPADASLLRDWDRPEDARADR